MAFKLGDGRFAPGEVRTHLLPEEGRAVLIRVYIACRRELDDAYIKISSRRDNGAIGALVVDATKT